MLNLVDLDERVRRYMVEEAESDMSDGTLYLSPRLSEVGQSLYYEILEEALLNGDDVTFATDLRKRGCIAEVEISHRKGVAYRKNVPKNAPEILAEGEFNRFYLRAICRVAMEESCSVEAYRARASSVPRPESEQLIGREFRPHDLLQDLRQNPGVDTALGLPPGPFSGVSGRLKLDD
jgi:hypothetical protein